MVSSQRAGPQGGFQNFQTDRAQPQSQPQSQPARESNLERSRPTEAAVIAPVRPVAASGGSFQCPDSFGFYSHFKSCDKYWACENGTATLKLCGNGLVFDDTDSLRENCAYPFSVDCGTRNDLGNLKFNFATQ